MPTPRAEVNSVRNSGVRAFCVVGLGYGDEGKGQCVDHLTREFEAHTVMRFSGGCQAAHNVIAPDGRHHTFSQFGSGIFAGAETYLGAGMMVNPLNMFNEYYHLASIGEDDAWDRLAVHKFCLVTTPVHAAANLLREFYRGDKAHGTTAQGIGETRWAAINLDDCLRVRDLSEKSLTRSKIGALIAYYADAITRWKNLCGLAQDSRITEARELLEGRRPDLVEAMTDRYWEWAERTRLVENYHLRRLFEKGNRVILEGSQGILIDERYGFHPHTTWANVSAQAARRELAVATLGPDEVHTIGVTRTYSTRHGNGPFPPEQSERWDPEPHNGDDGAAGQFRNGPFDAVAFAYAIRHTKPDSLAINHLETFRERGWVWPLVRSYEYFGDAGDLDRYFDMGEKGEIVEIKHGTLAHMECVTRRLFDCQPNVERLDPDPASIIDSIEQISGGIPVSVVGRGPSDYESIAAAVSS